MSQQIQGNILKAVMSIFNEFRTLFSKLLRVDSPVSGTVPSRSYQESVRRIDDLRNVDGDEVSSDGHLVFLTHGKRVGRVIVFFHGGTNSPRQFRALGEIFYNKGYNVLIPRVPHHGLKDRMTEDYSRLTVSELIELSDESVDIARGLGRHVIVAGLSMGANMACWIAQNRGDVDKAVIISPFWGWKMLPVSCLKLAINFLLILPDMFLWWSNEKKKELLGPTSAYYRFSTRGLAQIMLLGWFVIKDASRLAPKTQDILVVANALDESVNDRIFAKVIDNWKKHNGVRITRFEFDRSLGVLHDLIDPEQPYQRIAVIYPRLVELIEA
jgi:carboxylesterase